jgi:hypothetical protein
MPQYPTSCVVRRGIGWVDAHLLASALASGATLWSVEGDLVSAAEDLGVAYR